MGDISLPLLFVGLMVLEFAYNLWRGNQRQDPRDSALSVLVMIPHFAALSIVPVVWFVLYQAALPLVPWRLPVDAWWIWPLGIVVMDLAAYWMHRYHHALNLTWGVHAVHHSSPYFTVTTGGRSSLAEPLVNIASGAYLILVAPALLGLPAEAAALGWLVKDTWGFAVHTENVGHLGPLEWLLATPRHHSVHHATNPGYRDRNFGFVFIVWDRLFGTFTPLGDERPRYGVDDPPPTLRPLTVALHHLGRVLDDARATRRWRDKLRVWFMPAGWRPRDLPPRPPVAATALPAAAPGTYPVGTLQLATVAALLWYLVATLGQAGTAGDLALLGFVVTATMTLGELFERSSWLVPLELARAALVATMLATTGRWFGRPIDRAVLALLALEAACLAAALWVDRRLPRADAAPAATLSR